LEQREWLLVGVLRRRGDQAAHGQFRTFGVGAKLAGNRSLAFILPAWRLALHCPRCFNANWQLLRVASRDTVVDLHERIAKIYIPLFLGIS